MKKNDFIDSIKMRKVNRSDCMDLFRWRNDPETRNNSVLGSDPVPLNDHKKWFASKLNDPSSRLYMGVSGSKKVGLMRFEVEKGRMVVTTNVNPACRGMGVGSKIMGLTTMKTFEELGLPIMAKIKNDNIASIKMCARNGYCVKRKTKYITYMCFDGNARRRRSN